jgi:hypothetical protein
MNDSDFKPILVKDSRIGNITSQIGYGVFSGGASSTYTSYNAVSTTNNQLTFNVNVPSEHTIIDRNVLIQATYKIKLNITNIAKGSAVPFDYGLGDAFQAFPINSSFKNMSAVINNTTISINSQEVLPQLLRLIELREIQKYNGMSPTMLDIFKNNYADLQGNNNNPLGDYKSAGYDNLLLPRGSFPLKSILVNHYNAGGGFLDNTLISANATDYFEIFLEATFTEPIILSPFLFGGKNDFNNQGLVGINTINLICNIDTSLKRFFSTATPNMTISFDTITPITNAKLLFNFLTSKETDSIKIKNVVPYIDYPCFISSQNTVINAGVSSTTISQNIQLNQIPDLFIICVRKPTNSLTIQNPSSFLPIRNVSINLNNASGLLSSASTQDLWRMSKINGSTQSWLEFWGYANKLNTTKNVPQTIDLYTTSTSGSLLIINPARDLSLPNDISNGSIGAYNFQIKIDFINNTAENITPEICIITANSGVLVNNNGSSSVYTGMLTKNMVIESNLIEEGVPSASYNRLVGGGNDNTEIDKPIKSKYVVRIPTKLEDLIKK